MVWGPSFGRVAGILNDNQAQTTGACLSQLLSQLPFRRVDHKAPQPLTNTPCCITPKYQRLVGNGGTFYTSETCR